MRSRAQPLSPAAHRILRAALVAIRPHGHGFDQDIDDDVVAGIEDFFPYLPAPMRLAFPIGLRLLEWAPLLVVRRPTRLSRMDVAEARHYLERALAVGGPLGALVLGVRALVLLNFYQHPAVLETMEVDWAGRRDALVTRRAELLQS
jgi:hypothetical protein